MWTSHCCISMAPAPQDDTRIVRSLPRITAQISYRSPPVAPMQQILPPQHPLHPGAYRSNNGKLKACTIRLRRTPAVSLFVPHDKDSFRKMSRNLLQQNRVIGRVDQFGLPVGTPNRRLQKRCKYGRSSCSNGLCSPGFRLDEKLAYACAEGRNSRYSSKMWALRCICMRWSTNGIVPPAGRTPDGEPIQIVRGFCA